MVGIGIGGEKRKIEERKVKEIDIEIGVERKIGKRKDEIKREIRLKEENSR